MTFLRTLWVFIIGLSIMPLMAQEVPADSVSDDGSMSFHGQRISDEGAINMVQLANGLSTAGAMEAVKVSGEVDGVCQAKGCWMTLTLPEGDKMRVTFKDYAFFVPTDASGKTAIVSGRAYLDTTSVADLRHFAEDGGMSAEEAAEKYTEPKVEVAFKATGVIIREEE